MLAKIDVADPYYRRGDVIDRAKVEELLNNSPFIKKADSLEELGKQCGFEDVKNFLAEVEAYNQCFDAETGKGSKVRQIAQGFEEIRHAALLCDSDFSAGAEKFRRRQNRSALPRAE